MLLPIIWIALTVVILSLAVTSVTIVSILGARYAYSRREEIFSWVDKYWTQAFYRIRYLIKK